MTIPTSTARGRPPEPAGACTPPPVPFTLLVITMATLLVTMTTEEGPNVTLLDDAVMAVVVATGEVWEGVGTAKVTSDDDSLLVKELGTSSVLLTGTAVEERCSVELDPTEEVNIGEETATDVLSETIVLDLGGIVEVSDAVGSIECPLELCISPLPESLENLNSEEDSRASELVGGVGSKLKFELSTSLTELGRTSVLRGGFMLVLNGVDATLEDGDGYRDDSEVLRVLLSVEVTVGVGCMRAEVCSIGEIVVDPAVKITEVLLSKVPAFGITAVWFTVEEEL
ncbi:hypothetical protein Bbelb_247500 [Branchiostoma belcheri]|nr:hypothetical protein Bbelb_247500 [Branchiostoma belcheri]